MFGAPVRPPQPELGLKAAFGATTDWETSDGDDRYLLNDGTDADGMVNFVDLLIVLRGWGPCMATCCPGDVDGDGEVTVLDLLAVLSDWD